MPTIFKCHELHSTDWKRPQHRDSQSLEKCSQTLFFIFYQCRFCPTHKFPVWRIVRLNDSLDVVNRIYWKPRKTTCYTACEERDLFRRRVIIGISQLTNNTFISSKVYPCSNDLPKYCGVKSLVKTLDSMLVKNFSSDINWTLVFCIVNCLHLDSHMIDRCNNDCTWYAGEKTCQ